jgi:probable F420-dependent oxidoreductase
MKLDTYLDPARLRDIPAAARAAEALGFDGLWLPETQHDPFQALAMAAEHTERIELGTAVAIAFARSPALLAYSAWDLAALSDGRFNLGLGTQVQAHIERRFGMTWEAPVAKLREAVQGIRAFWDCWQNGTRLNLRGRFYRFTLMTPFFNPGPIEHPRIPIYIAGVNTALCRLAGEVADGFHVHPFHTRDYLEHVILPNIEAGAAEAGRTRGDVQLVTTAFAVVGDTEAERAAIREEVRQQIAFYGSTPSYRSVWAQHGWEATGERLSTLAARGQWAEMPGAIDDEQLEAFVVSGAWEGVAARLRTKYAGLLDRVALYRPFVSGADEAGWRRFVSAASAIREVGQQG